MCRGGAIEIHLVDNDKVSKFKTLEFAKDVRFANVKEF